MDEKKSEEEKVEGGAQEQSIHVPKANFEFLIQTFYIQAMINCGKIPNPANNQQEPNKEMATFNIDMLEMLKTKTQGNLEEDEGNLLEETLHQARMAFVEMPKGD